MKKLFKTVCVILSFCICVPLFTACAGKATDVTTNKLDYAKLTDTSNSVLPKPEYTLPALGSILETVVPGQTYSLSNDYSDYARYADEFYIVYSEGVWWQQVGYGSQVQYKPAYQRDNSSLNGKTIYWLGSSETFGPWSALAVPEYLAALTGCKVVKNAYSETTLIRDRSRTQVCGQWPDLNNEGSKTGRNLGEYNFIDRLDPDFGGSQNTAYNGYESFTRPSFTKFDKNEQVDLFICAISTNDASSLYCGNGTENRWGTIKPFVWDKSNFDVSTTIGAMEYVVSYVWETWHCPVLFYSSPYFSGANSISKPHPWDADPTRVSVDPKGEIYAAEISWAKMIAKKWTAHGVPVGVIDMFNDADFNAVGDTLYEVKDRSTGVTSWKTYYEWAMYDHVHGKNAGFMQWWTPYVEWYIHNFFIKNK